jgi:hypothetical protein
MIGIIWTLLAVILVGLYNGLLLADDKLPESDPTNPSLEKKWHFVGAALFCFLAGTAWWFWGIRYVPFVLSAFWVLFGGIVHIVGLRRPFFFVGTTALTDRILRKVSAKSPETVSAILKSLALIGSIFIIFGSGK